MIAYGNTVSPFQQGGATPGTFTRSSVAYDPYTGAQVASGVPRFPNIAGTVGLMVEEGTSNLFTYSDPATVDATTFPVSSGVTATTGVGYGLTGGVYFVDNAATRYAYKTPALAVNTTYTVSAFIRMDDGTAPTTSDFSLVLASSVLNFDTVKDLGSGLYRVSGTATTPATISVYNTGILKFNTRSVKGFKASGFQCEQKSYTTSYVPTTSATATRAAESLTVPTAGILSPSQGTIIVRAYVDGDAAAATDSTFHYLYRASDPGAGANNNTIGLGIKAGTPGIWRAFIANASGSVTEITWAQRLSVGWHTIGLKYKAGELSLWVDGTRQNITTTPNMPSGIPNTSAVGLDPNGSAQWNNPIDGIRISTTALSDAEMAQATAGVLPASITGQTYAADFNGTLYAYRNKNNVFGVSDSLPWL